MNWVKVWINYFLWLFRPRTILDACRTIPFIKIQNWEFLLFVSDPNEIKKVNIATGTVFLGGKGNAFLQPLLGDQSVFLLEGEQHKLARSLILKAMGPNQIERQNKQIKFLLESFVTNLTKQKKFEIIKANRWLTFQIVMQFAFPSPNEAFTKQLFNRFEKTTGLLANFVSYNKSFWFPVGKISVGHFVKRLVDDIDHMLYQQIEKHKESANTKEGHYLIDVLIREQQTHQYSDQFIRDNIVSVIAAGYDTTGSAVSWLCFWLAKTPRNYLRELQNEISIKPNRLYPLTTAFINESLRYCPPLEILPRKINPDAISKAQEILGHELTNKVAQQDGLVAPCPYGAHHDPNTYDKPEIFNYMRFVDESYKPHEFLPFGGGSRLCLGYMLSTEVLKMYLHTFLEQGKTLRLSRNQKYCPVRRNVSLWPGYKMTTTIEEIEP